MALIIRSADLSGNRLLRRLIEDPALPATIQSLSPESLGRLIDHVGLEDSGEIVACATSEQLLDVFDTDLWIRAASGTDDIFDPQRFLLWLEILLEAGEKTVAKRLADLPADFVIAAFFEHILVLNLDDLAEAEQAWETDDINLTDKVLSDCLGYELDEFYIVARRERGWDTLVTVLTALYDHESALLTRILERCCFASAEFIEDNGGLYDVLSAAEMLVSDAAAEREDRRAKKGYIAPSDATAFLKNALRATVDELLRTQEDDPVTRAYFRNLDRTNLQKNGLPIRGKSTPVDAETKSAEVRQLLISAGIVEPAASMNRLEAPAKKETKTRRMSYHRLLSGLAATQPEVYETKVRYLIYLANVVEAAFGRTQAPVRPADALKAVFEIIDIGLAHFLDGQTAEGQPVSSTSIVEDLAPNGLFSAGYQLLNNKVSVGNWSTLQKALHLIE